MNDEECRKMKKLMDEVLAPSRQLKKMMDDALGPSREMKRLMDEASAPSRQMQKLMDDALTPSREIKRLMDEALAPSRQMKKLIDEALTPSREMKRQIDETLAPSREVKRLMDEALSPSREMQKLMKDVLAPFARPVADDTYEHSSWRRLETQLKQSAVFKIQTELSRGLSGLANLRTRPGDVLATLQQCAGVIGTEQLREMADVFPGVNPDGSVSLNGEVIGIREIEDAFLAFFGRIREIGGDLSSLVMGFRKPIQALIIHILIPVLVNYCVCVYFAAQSSLELQELQRQFNAQNAATRRDVVKATRDLTVALETNIQWRVVATAGLRVRSHPSLKGPIRATLPFGTVVQFVEKHGRWTRIQFKLHDAHELVEGWVLNKYLTRTR